MCIGVSFNLRIHASINSLVTYKLKGLRLFVYMFRFRSQAIIFIYNFIA